MKDIVKLEGNKDIYIYIQMKDNYKICYFYNILIFLK